MKLALFAKSRPAGSTSGSESVPTITAKILTDEEFGRLQHQAGQTELLIDATSEYGRMLDVVEVDPAAEALIPHALHPALNDLFTRLASAAYYSGDSAGHNDALMGH